jgi:GTP cyclohydrolase I
LANNSDIEKAIKSILKAIGEDPSREGLRDTPRRIAEMYADIFSGLEADPRQVLTTGFDEGHHEMVIIKDIPFYSMCEHHLLPFLGTAHVAYIPRDGRITGISKLARIVEAHARRLQVQERMTTDIARSLNTTLQPRGVMVVIEAEHLCMTMRGIKKPGSLTVTSVVTGLFREYDATRAEAMNLIKGSR